MRKVAPDEIEKFIMEYHPRQEWKDKSKVRAWLNWMMGKGCIDTFTTDGKDIALVLCHRLTNKENAGQDFYIDPTGDCVAIDLIVSKEKHNKIQLSAVAQHLRSKYGIDKTVYWRRRENHPKTFAAKNLAARLGLIPQ